MVRQARRDLRVGRFPTAPRRRALCCCVTVSRERDSFIVSEELFSDVTMVIPAYNAAATIERTIRSARWLAGARVVVVDDGSTDDTTERARGNGAEVVSQPNQGAAVARKTGLAVAETPLVIFEDSDDQLLAGIRTACKVIRSDERIACVGGRAVFAAADGSKVRRPTGAEPGVIGVEDLLRRRYAPFPPSAAVWRTAKAREAALAQPPSLQPRFAEDFELLIRAAIVGSVVAIEDFTSSYSSVGGKSFDNAVDGVRDSERIRQYYSAFFGIDVDLLTPRQIKDQAAWRKFFATGKADKPLSILRYAFDNRGLLGRFVRKRMESH